MRKHSREAQGLRSELQRQGCLGVRKPLQAVEHRADRLMYSGVSFRALPVAVSSVQYCSQMIVHH